MGYMESQVDQCRKGGNLGTRVGNIGNGMVCEREGDAGRGNPWWKWLKVGSRSAYKERWRKGGRGGAWGGGTAWRMRVGGRDSGCQAKLWKKTREVLRSV